MSELVERLRACANGIGSLKDERGDYGICDTAADRIEALEAELAEAHTKAFEEAREAAAVLLDERIASGYPTPAHKVEQCQHGKFGWEDCIACYDDALLGTLGSIRSLQPTGIGG